jgi:hypothetical protein
VGTSSRTAESGYRMIEVGHIYRVRCVEAGAEDWRRLLVVGHVPASDSGPTTIFAVQKADAPLETRDVLKDTLLNDCDLEVPS